MRAPLAPSLASLLILLAASTVFASEDHARTFDAARLRAPSAAKALRAPASAEESRLRQLYSVESIDERYGVPSFVWAPRSSAALKSGAALRSAPTRTADQAARSHLSGVAPLYRLAKADVDGARLRHVHDTGRGAIVATYAQVIDGIEVFRDEIKVGMDRSMELVSVSGHIAPRALAASGKASEFTLTAEQAAGAMLRDYADLATIPVLAAKQDVDDAGFDRFEAPAELKARGDGLAIERPLRVRQVWFRLADSLVPAYHLEVMGETEAYAYVVSAVDGSLLFKHSLMQDVAFSYRTWADTSSPFLPFDGPQGAAPSPHPTGSVDFYNPAFIPASLVTLQNGPISTNDPWLPPGATETVGNNVNAYVDLVSPDGLSAGDFRAATTSAGVFDHTYNPALAPNASVAQRSASVTTLFYLNNFLHDWFYDAGFDEACGNAQTDNFGRGGIGGDAIHAQGQDYGGTNNANMSTPSDGGAPRMQMYVFNVTSAQAQVTSPPAIAGTYVATVATGFGPQTFSISGAVAEALDGTAPTTDICTAVVNAANIAGKIALIDRGICSFPAKVQFAQNAGAIGVIVVNNVNITVPTSLSGTSGTITIPSVMVSQAVGNAIRAQLGAGVNVTLTRQANVARDGTIDGHIVAHEWGHYLSNRLVGNAVGLSTNQAGGMGEGWSDFVALLMTARPADSPVDFSGIYNVGPYALSASGVANHAYYFGIRRYPYSTDMTKAPLTYGHIVPFVPLPVGIPVNSNADPAGSNNNQVHRTGEVWCNMLWECYAALLRDTGRLTYAQANQRMREYLVAGFKLTPDAPTLVDARNALLAAVAAGDQADFALFIQAFAKRGLGIGAVAGDPNDNTGAVQSFVTGGDLRIASLSLTDDLHSCDDDGYLDNGESGTLVVEIFNSGSSSLSSTMMTVTSSDPSVTFPGGNVVAVPNSAPFTLATATIAVDLNGALAASVMTLNVAVDDPGLLAAGPRLASYDDYVHADEGSSASDNAEAHNSSWTSDAAPGSPGGPWRRVQITPSDHEYFLEDVGTTTDLRLVSPPLSVDPALPLTITFSHRFSFEFDGSFNYDGGVVELSTDGGSNWIDIGASSVPGYTGSLNGPGNPLATRNGFVRASTGYPSMVPTTISLGTTYAGQTIQLRLRHGADPGVGGPGWWIDDLVASGITNQPFVSLLGEVGVCSPLSVSEALPTELALSLAGRNPASGPARLRFALPTAQRVSLTVHDLAGRRVATIAEGDYSAGRHEAVFTRMADGSLPGAGVYFARLAAGDRMLTSRMVLIR